MRGTKEALAGIQPGDSISVMIGPEGGFSEEEIAYVPYLMHFYIFQ